MYVVRMCVVRVAFAAFEGQENGRKEVRGRQKTRASGKSKMRTTVAASSTGDARASVHVGTYNNLYK